MKKLSYLFYLAVCITIVQYFFIVTSNAQNVEEKPRILAKGVMQTIQPDIRLSEAYSVHDVFELVAQGDEKNNYDWAKDQRFERLVIDENGAKEHALWCVEFQFKPIRLIEVELPTINKKMEKKIFWYMVYSVTNKQWTPEGKANLTQWTQINKNNAGQMPLDFDCGTSMTTKQDSDKSYRPKGIDIPITCMPQFILASNDIRVDKKARSGYVDEFNAIAFNTIIQKEDPNRHFETTISMSDRKLAPGETAWGIVMWSDIDPQIKEFSVFISGLTNAYLWTDNKENYVDGAPIGSGREMFRKTLKLNFWAPGDPLLLLQKEIRYGVKGGVDHEWVYR